jgi:NTE family protein
MWAAGKIGKILAQCLVSSALLLPGTAIAQDDQPSARPRIGLVLSGGGARGIAHVGVIKVLDQLRIPIDLIAGTSMGAIVGGLYASGMPAAELEEVFRTADWSVLLADRPPRAERSFRRKSDDFGYLIDFDIGVDASGLIFPEGLVQGQNLEMTLKKLTLPSAFIDDFDELPISFRAMATDIATGEAVVLDSGDLATALRASMSAPGVFKPVRYQGHRLVDGGIANNLPIRLAREMGADIIIVVDVGFPLLPESELHSGFELTQQMLTILIGSQVREQLELMGKRDVLVSPELGNFGSQDFQRAEEALQRGEDKALEIFASLADLSLSREAYAAYRNRVESARQDPPVIDRVMIENESRLSTEVIAARLSELRGKPLDADQLEADIASVYGFDTFEIVTYDLVKDTDGTTLALKATEKSWGPNFLRLGLNIEDDFSGDSNYNIGARLTRVEINSLGGELRGEIQIGETPRLFAELYQPLDYASRWFVNPQIEFRRDNSPLFEDKFQIAQFRSDVTRLSVAGGRQFGNWGEARVSLNRAHSESSPLIGQPGFEKSITDINSGSVEFAIDTIDHDAIPRAGFNLSVGWQGARESLGSDLEFDAAAAHFLEPQSWGAHTLLHWWDIGTTLEEDSGEIQPFTLGGLFRLSGYAADELVGRHVGIGRLLYYRRMGVKPLSSIESPIYLGTSIEVGNVWQDTDEISFDNTLVAGSIFIAIDSPLGPLYVAYGAAEGDRQSAYVFLGQTF